MLPFYIIQVDVLDSSKCLFGMMCTKHLSVPNNCKQNSFTKLAELLEASRLPAYV